MSKQSFPFLKISILTVIVSGVFMGFCAWLAYGFFYWYQRNDSVPFWMMFTVFLLSVWLVVRQSMLYYIGLKKPSFLILEDDAVSFYTHPTGGNLIPYNNITFIQLTYETAPRGGVYNGKIILDFVEEAALLNNPNAWRARDIQQAIVDLKYIHLPFKWHSVSPYLLKIQEIENAIRERCPNLHSQFSRQFLLEKEELEEGKRRTREWLDSFKK